MKTISEYVYDTGKILTCLDENGRRWMFQFNVDGELTHSCEVFGKVWA